MIIASRGETQNESEFPILVFRASTGNFGACSKRSRDVADGVDRQLGERYALFRTA